MQNTVQYISVFILILVLSHTALAEQGLFIPLGTTGKPAKIITVSHSGGDFSDPVAAVTSITDASADNRYLVLIGPGVYMVKETLAMKPFVDIAGSGREVTRLTGAISSEFYFMNSSALVSGADHAILSELTIENTGGGVDSVAMSNVNSSPVIHDFTAISSGGSSNYGVYNFHSSPTMTNVNATASGGINSFGVWNSSSSPAMTNVTATASGGTSNYGVYNFDSSPTMTNVTVTASGGVENRSVHNDTSSPAMTNVTSTAFGGTYNYGITNNYSSPIMTDVSVIVSSKVEGYGVSNFSSFPVIRHSTVKVDSGFGDGIYVYGGITRVMHSSIIGGVYVDTAGTGTLSCVHSDDGDASPLSDVCE